MATDTASILTSSFVRNSNLQPQLYSSEGEKLNDKVAAIKDNEPLQRLLQQLKSLNNERHSELRAYLILYLLKQYLLAKLDLKHMCLIAHGRFGKN